MSYIVIPVYDFACDQVLPNGQTCARTWECTPANMGTYKLLDKAHQLLRKDGWRVIRLDGNWLHYCPKHIAVATSED